MAGRARAVVRYDGPAIIDHEMDVHDLAPSLLALADLCKVANEIFNGDAASVRVLVRADHEQKCFQLQLDLVQTLYEQLTVLMAKDSVKNAKDILEWIGIVGLGTVIGAAGLLGLYKKLSSMLRELDPALPQEQVEARPEQPTQIATQAQSHVIEAHAADGGIVYQIVGDGAQITVSPEVHQLAQDPRTFPIVKRILAPLAEDGYTKLEFEVDGRVTQYFSREEAEKIIGMPETAIIARGTGEHVSQIRTSVRVRKAVFEGSARWGVMYRKAIDARMDDHQWLEDYQAGRILLGPGWKLIVDLEERVIVDESGEQVGEATYAIKKVLGVEPPPNQIRLL